MKLLGLIGTILEHTPFVGSLIPKDKPWFQSATVAAGVLWGTVETVAPLVSAAFPAAAPVCLAISNAFRVAGPALMILGVRKTVIDNANGNPNVKPPATQPPK